MPPAGSLHCFPKPHLVSPFRLHAADLIAVPTDDVKTAGFQLARGLLLDLSFAVGSMQVDAGRNEMVYGPGAERGGRGGAA